MGNPLYVMRNKKFFRLSSSMTWGEVSELLSVDEETLKRLNFKLIHIKLLNKGTVLTYPGRALNVSYSENGLKWTANKLGKLLYFENAFLVQKDGRPSFQGKDLKRSKQVIVEEFVPRDHIFNSKIQIEDQKAEYLWINKGLNLLYSNAGANWEQYDDAAQFVKEVGVVE